MQGGHEEGLQATQIDCPGFWRQRIAEMERLGGTTDTLGKAG